MSEKCQHFLLLFSAEFKWPTGQMDVETAFLQALEFTRRIYVSPPRDASTPHLLWSFELPAYGLTDLGWLWYLTSYKELMKSFGLKISSIYCTLYYSRDQSGSTEFVLAVQVDDYVYTGTTSRMHKFEDFLASTFDISKFARGTPTLMVCEFTQDDDFSVCLS